MRRKDLAYIVWMFLKQVITKRDKLRAFQKILNIHYKLRQKIIRKLDRYCKVRLNLLESMAGITKYQKTLLESLTDITKCESYYKLKLAPVSLDWTNYFDKNKIVYQAGTFCYFQRNFTFPVAKI